MKWVGPILAAVMVGSDTQALAAEFGSGAREALTLIDEIEDLGEA